MPKQKCSAIRTILVVLLFCGWNKYRQSSTPRLTRIRRKTPNKSTLLSTIESLRVDPVLDEVHITHNLVVEWVGGRRRTIVERYRIQSARCYLTAVHNKSYSLKVIQYPIASPPVQGSRSQKSESPVIILSSFFVVVRQQSVGRRRRLKDTNYKQGLLLSYPVVCQRRQGYVWEWY